MTQSSSSATKRPRRDTSADDNRAECPFSVRIVGPREKELKAKSKKRRKRGHNSSGTGNHPDDDDQGSRKTLNQCAPFSPKGAFDTNSTMDVHYVVEPAKQWADMTRYNSFVLNNVKYYCEGFIYVANESSIERQKGAASAASTATVAPNTAGAAAGSNGAAPTNGATGGSSAAADSAASPTAITGRDPRKRSEDDWVARILEIRASDEHHVYARVFWMYWPDELPAGTHYGKRQVQGRQPYHGASELIASNHMDIINVVSVTSMASVNQLIEDKDDDVQSALYWRQALDVRNMELSSIENICECNQPANPDKMLVGCGDESCGKWLHEECLKHYALMRVYERLGRDKPHIPDKKEGEDGTADAASAKEKETAAAAAGGTGAVLKSETASEDVKEPLSPRESGGAVSAQHSIDVKASDDVDGAVKSVNGSENGETPTKDVALRGKKKDAQLKRELTPSDSAKKLSATAVSAVPAKNRKLPPLHSFDGKKKPYDKLFDATLLLTPLESSAAPTMMEIKDLRTSASVAGGAKEWLEPAECPACGAVLR